MAEEQLLQRHLDILLARTHPNAQQPLSQLLGGDNFCNSVSNLSSSAPSALTGRCLGSSKDVISMATGEVATSYVKSTRRPLPSWPSRRFRTPRLRPSYRETSSSTHSATCRSSRLFRYSFTQDRRLASLTPSSPAISAIVRGGVDSTTILAACSLNSGVYLFRLPDIRSRSLPGRSYRTSCPGTVRHFKDLRLPPPGAGGTTSSLVPPLPVAERDSNPPIIVVHCGLNVVLLHGYLGFLAL